MSFRRGGFSLPELLIVCGIFSSFLAATYIFLTSGMAVWRKTEDKQDAADQLRRAVASLKGDLSASSFQVCAVNRFDGVAKGGDVLWMLSALDQNTGDLVRFEGAPFWQRNLVYYVAVPRDHNSRHPGCSGEPSSCPHKVLLRKVVDSGPPTGAGSPPSEIEKLLEARSASRELLQPRSFHSDRDFSVVARGIADFSVVKAPDPEGGDEVEVSLTAVDEQQSRPNAVRRIVFSVFPDNEARP